MTRARAVEQWLARTKFPEAFVLFALWMNFCGAVFVVGWLLGVGGGSEWQSIEDKPLESLVLLAGGLAWPALIYWGFRASFRKDEAKRAWREAAPEREAARREASEEARAYKQGRRDEHEAWVAAQPPGEDD